MEKQWLVRTLCTLCGTLLGIVVAGASIVQECKINTIEVKHLTESKAAMIDQQRLDRESFDRRMGTVVALIEENTKTVRELISLDREYITMIKLQQAQSRP